MAVLGKYNATKTNAFFVIGKGEPGDEAWRFRLHASWCRSLRKSFTTCTGFSLTGLAGRAQSSRRGASERLSRGCAADTFSTATLPERGSGSLRLNAALRIEVR